MPAAMEPAIKHTYVCGSDEWFSEKTEVSIADRSFAQGGMRKCYKCYEKCVDGGKVYSGERAVWPPTPYERIWHLVAAVTLPAVLVPARLQLNPGDVTRSNTHVHTRFDAPNQSSQWQSSP